MLLASFLALAAFLPVGQALRPTDVFIVFNQKMPASREVADHYSQKRQVPPQNLVGLDLPEGEEITRRDFDSRLLGPLRTALQDRRPQVKVLLTVYGVPLRVGRSEPAVEDRAELSRLLPLLDHYRDRLKPLQTQISQLESRGTGLTPEETNTLAIQKSLRDQLQVINRGLETRRNAASHAESEASVDSELALLWWPPYELRRWQMNPLYFQVEEKVRAGKPPVVLVSRLDGPTPAVAKGLVDAAVETEAKGLQGKVYFDARGIAFQPKQDTGHGYGGYDESLREAAKLLKDEAKLNVTLDDRAALFAPGTCPDCALYCGWYSLANYVASCRFTRGAVAYHIASSEAVTLRDPKTRQWCKSLLEAGVAVTLGPVAEPYTVGFPKPAEFFGFLVSGEYTVVECYWKTSLFASWMTTLIGDPLYNPYAKTPKFPVEKVVPSPRGASSLPR